MATREIKIGILLLLFLSSPLYSQKAPEPGALATAAAIGDLSLVDTLLLRGADPDQPDSLGNTALIYAVKSGRTELVKRILDANADPDKPGAEQLTALMAAIEMSRQDLVIFLLSRGADPNLIQDTSTQESSPVSALSLALDRGEYDIAEILFNSGASALLLKNPSDSIPDPLNLPELQVPLDARIWRNRSLIKDYVLEKGPIDWRELRAELDDGRSVDKADLQGVTDLMSAAWYGNAPVVSLLLQRGADPLQQDTDGRDALTYAAAAGESATLGLLLESLENRVKPLKAELSRSPLYFAVGNRNHEVLNLLLESGTFSEISFNETDEEGITLLMMAAWLSDYYAVEKLMPLVDGGIPDEAGRKALAWCAAAFERDRETGRAVGIPEGGSRNYPIARLLAARQRNPRIYSTQPTKDLHPAVIDAWSPGRKVGEPDNADDWRDKRPSPVPAVSGDGDLTLYRIFRDEEPGKLTL